MTGDRSTDNALSFDELTRRPVNGSLRCLRCGKEGMFSTAADADRAGWDVAPYFALEPLCPNCPLGAWASEFLSSELDP